MKPEGQKQPEALEEARGPAPDSEDDRLAGDLEIEKKLIQLAQLDIEKLDVLYRKYRPRIFSWIMWAVKDEDTASNLTDETFSRAVDKVGQFKWRGYSFGAWLFKIARNVVALDFREKSLKPEVRYNPDFHDRGHGGQPDLDLEKNEEDRLLGLCLDRLRPSYREAILNHYGLGMTTREAGIVMGIPESTVKSHLQRARRELRKCLLAHGVDRGLSSVTQKMIRESAIQEDGWGVMGADDEQSK